MSPKASFASEEERTTGLDAGAGGLRGLVFSSSAQNAVNVLCKRASAVAGSNSGCVAADIVPCSPS